MLTKKIKRLRDKPLPDWPVTEFERNCKKFVKLIKKEGGRIIDWLLFYQPSDKIDKMMHIIEIVALLIIIRGLAR